MVLTIKNLDKVYSAGKASIDTMELKGYELIKVFFVDSSGMGLESEPALTLNQFDQLLYKTVRDHGKLTAKIIEDGQFQVNVGLFKKTGKSKAKRIANNTLHIDDGGGNYRIRLHDTDIITFKDGVYYINNGGWATRTTHDRLNKHLPSSVRVYSKDYETRVSVNGTELEYYHNIALPI